MHLVGFTVEIILIHCITMYFSYYIWLITGTVHVLLL